MLYTIFYRLLAVIICLPPHEWAHARAAKACGDDTAERQGRLTLNPLAHLSLSGTIMLLLFGFGYAKPVPINPNRFRNPRRDTALTALAGPAMNLAIAAGFIFLYGFFGFGIFLNMASISASLCVFNLIPIPPLDGSQILGAIFPEAGRYMHDMGNVMTIVLFVLLFIIVWLTPVMSVVTGWVLDLLYPLYRLGVFL